MIHATEVAVCRDEEGISPLFWYVAYTQPRREEVAVSNLVTQGFETYLPLYRTVKKSQQGLLSSTEPMFPRYIFFKPKSGQSISAVRSTRGVAFTLSFGNIPATLKDEVLESIRQFELQRNSVNLSELSPFQIGVKVRFSSKELFGIEGLVTSVSSKRVTLLIDILGGHRKIGVEHHQIALI